MTAAHPEHTRRRAIPRRWITLGVVTAAALILVLDTSVLTVAIPTIIHDFHTHAPAPSSG